MGYDATGGLSVTPPNMAAILVFTKIENLIGKGGN